MALRRIIVGIGAAMLLLLVAPADAQPPRGAAAALRIDGFDVEQVASLAPGTVLVFSVFATPGAAATVLIEGSPRLLELREIEAGVYEGAYTLGNGERIRPDAHVIATVWRDGIIARAELDEPLLLDGPRPATAEPAPVRPRHGYEAAPLPMPAPQSMPVPPPATVFPAAPTRIARGEAACADCARVESIRTVEPKDGPAVAGAVAGGIAGAVFGDAIGRAHERHVTRVLGAIGGALLGREIERRASGHAWYEATLRLPNGERRVRRYDAMPGFRVGDVVRLDPATLAGTT